MSSSYQSLVRPDGAFAGYASLFGVLDSGLDVVEPGAFRKSLARRGANAIRLLWQHEPKEPIGRLIRVSEDQRGLWVEGRLTLSSVRGRDAAALLADRGIDGLSIGFRAVNARRDPQSGVRRLSTVDLYEVSIVTFPMLDVARIVPVSMPTLKVTSSKRYDNDPDRHE